LFLQLASEHHLELLWADLVLGDTGLQQQAHPALLVDTLGFLAHLAAIVELHKEILLEPIVYHLLDF
jgi:hypothetical protein